MCNYSQIVVSVVVIQIIGICAYPTVEYNSEQSFKRLESGESEGEVVNQCCQRESKYVSIGHGTELNEVKLVDVGQCRQKCVIPIAKPLRREEFDKYLRKYPDMDPIQIFLSLQNMHPALGDSPSSSSASGEDGGGAMGSSTAHENNNKNSGLGSSPAHTQISASCLQSICLPSSIRRESYYDLSGDAKEIDVIESCDCVTLPQNGGRGHCQRLHSLVKIHVDTPYEKEVDLGQCLGACEDSSDRDHCLSCKPIRNRTISVDGPNGAHCLGVIDECQCVGDCFRLRQFLKVYDYTHVFEAKAAAALPLINSIESEDDRGANNVTTDVIMVNFNATGSLNIPSEPLIKVCSLL